MIWLEIINLSVLLATLVCGLSRLRRLDSSMRVMVYLVAATLASELISSYTSRVYRSNTAVYHCFNFIELIFAGCYFEQVLKPARRGSIAVSVALLSLCALITNLRFFQPLDTLNSNFLLFEGFVIISLCLFTLRRMFLDETFDFVASRDFWICLLLMFYWCTTFISWSIYTIVNLQHVPMSQLLTFIIWSANVVVYAGIGLVFLKKKSPVLVHEG